MPLSNLLQPQFAYLRKRDGQCLVVVAVHDGLLVDDVSTLRREDSRNVLLWKRRSNKDINLTKIKKAAFGLRERSSKEEWIGGLEGPLLSPKKEASDALSKGVNQILFCCWLLFGRCSGEGGRLLDRRLLLY